MGTNGCDFVLRKGQYSVLRDWMVAKLFELLKRHNRSQAVFEYLPLIIQSEDVRLAATSTEDKEIDLSGVDRFPFCGLPLLQMVESTSGDHLAPHSVNFGPRSLDWSK